MTDPFGHHAATARDVFIDTWGLGPLVLRFKGKVWRFEFSTMFGPSLLTRSGDVSSVQPVSEKHPFWEAFEAWVTGGKRHRAVRGRNGRVKFYVCTARKKA